MLQSRRISSVVILFVRAGPTHGPTLSSESGNRSVALEALHFHSRQDDTI